MQLIEKRPRPEGWAEEYARTFTDHSVARAYCKRPEYPPETFKFLRTLAGGHAGLALDLGCGTGFVARNLDFADHVDAVDFSENMIRIGRELPAKTTVRWIVGKAEEAPLAGPYDLVTAGESLHWMEWDVLLPRLEGTMRPGAPFAILDLQFAPNPWDEACRPVISRFSTNKKFKSVDLIAEIEERGLFLRRGESLTDSVAYSQSVAEYIESYHARNGLSRERLGEAAADFDREMAEILARYSSSSSLRLEVRCKVVWGDVL